MLNPLTGHPTKASWDPIIRLSLSVFLLVETAAAAVGLARISKFHEDDPRKVEEKLKLYDSGIVYTRGMWEPGATEFLRENYAEPYWNRTRYNLTGLDEVAGKLVEKEYHFYIHKGVPPKLRNLDTYTLEVLDQVYKNRLVQMAIRTYDDPRDRSRTVDPALVSRIKCHAHLDYLMPDAERWRKLSETGDLRHMRLLDPEIGSFFDSYARDEPGLLMGNTIWVGQPSECEQRRIFDLRPIHKAMPIKFNGRYCVASIKSKSWSTLIDQKEAKLTALNYWKYPNQKQEYRKALNLQIGLCLPDSCDTKTLLEARMEELQFLATLRLSHPWKNYTVDDLWCVPDANSEFMQFSKSTIAFIFTCIAVFACCLLATLYGSAQGEQQIEGKDVNQRSVGEKWVSCFSFKLNWARLTATRGREGHKNLSPPIDQSKVVAGPNPLDLSFLDFFKVLSMLAIIMAHVGNFLFQYSKNGLQFSEVGEGVYVYFLISLAYFVDYFFVITGLITGYVGFSTRMVEKLNTIQWVYTIFHRWVRLGPPFLLVSWFSRSLLRHLGHGPYWDYGTTRMTLRKRCMESSYVWPALMITNLHPIYEECINPSWYISSDMQFYLLTPFILVALYKIPRATYVSSAIAIAVFIHARYQIYMTDPAIRHLDLARVRQDCYMRNSWDSYHLYLHPQHRFPTYLLGLLAGHYVFMLRSGKWKSWLHNANGHSLSKIQQVGRKFLALISATMCVLVLRGPKVLESTGASISDPAELRVFISLGYAAQFLNAGFWATALFVFILLGEFKRLRKFCERPQWTIISKFNYFVLLIHVEIIYLWVLNSPNIEIQTLRQVASLFILTVVSSYSASIILTLMFEMPMAQLERQFVATLFVRGESSRKSKKDLTGDSASVEKKSH